MSEFIRIPTIFLAAALTAITVAVAGTTATAPPHSGGRYVSVATDSPSPPPSGIGWD